MVNLFASRYCAEAVMARIRDGVYPDDSDAKLLISRPLLDALRECVGKSDIQILQRMAADRTGGPMDALAIGLLRRHCSDPTVQEWLRDRWKTADPYIRTHLLWRILDDTDLQPEWHSTLFGFVLDCWDVFKLEPLSFFGGSPEKVIPSVLSRLADPTFPESKKWAYLCCLPELAADQDAACFIVSTAKYWGDQFTKRVAEHLIDRFWS